MFVRLLLAFSLIPLIELALLIKLGGMMGLIPTILLVAGTGSVGAYLAKSQGFKLLREIRATLERGEVPAGHLIEGMLILIGAILLITPGVLTDLTGFILFIPFTRRIVAKYTRNLFTRWLKAGKFNVSYSEFGRAKATHSGVDTSGSVDVDFEDLP